MVGRFDSRWSNTFESDDPAQEFSDQLQLETLRAEYGAPTGWNLGGSPLDYSLNAGVRRVVQGDIFGVKEFYDVGGGFEFLTGDMLPVVTGINFGASYILGDNLSGFAVGAGG